MFLNRISPPRLDECAIAVVTDVFICGRKAARAAEFVRPFAAGGGAEIQVTADRVTTIYLNDITIVLDGCGVDRASIQIHRAIGPDLQNLVNVQVAGLTYRELTSSARAVCATHNEAPVYHECPTAQVICAG